MKKKFLKNKNKIFYFATAILFCCVAFWFFTLPKIEDVKKVKIGLAEIKVELAVTPAQQVQGLSGRTGLATSTGMLFVFDHSSKWGIWMKDMNFPIDVLWFTEDLKVGYIVENMTPLSYPKIYEPNTDMKYVLEVPSGTVEKYGVKVGQSVVLK